MTGIVALAILIPLAAGLYDLSVGATAGLVSVTTVVLMNDHGWGPVPAIAFGMAVALIIGCINAFIVVRLGVNSFIATLGMSSILSATQVIVSHNAQPLPPTVDGLEQLHADRPWAASRSSCSTCSSSRSCCGG